MPGESEHENRRFVAFVAALLRGVNQHGDLLRCGVSTAGNDHRLGAQEAPPAIITLHVGKMLEQHLIQAAAGGPIAGYGMEAKEIPVSAPVADIRANLEDRNRTAPFPWCGNRFEFRAVGGNQHIAFPLTMVNAALADSLMHMCGMIEGGKEVDEVIRETLRDNQGALFSGDGYSQELYDFAEKSGLFHLKSSPEAYGELTSDKNVRLFGTLGIFNEREIAARRQVLEDAYATELRIEARTLLTLLRTQIIPAALETPARTGKVDSPRQCSRTNGLSSLGCSRKRRNSLQRSARSPSTILRPRRPTDTSGSSRPWRRREPSPTSSRGWWTPACGRCRPTRNSSTAINDAMNC